MNDQQLFVATLRCQSFHVWPERTVLEAESFSLELTPGQRTRAQLAVVSYLNRSKPAEYTDEITDIGPLVCNGRVPGLYVVRNQILKAPEDQISVSWQYAHARRGEIDISIAFGHVGEIEPFVHEALRCSTLAFMALLNLKLGDQLTPVAPLHVRKILQTEQGQFEATYTLAVRRRDFLKSEALGPVVSHLAKILSQEAAAQKLRTALELYGSHFDELQSRTR